MIDVDGRTNDDEDDDEDKVLFILSNSGMICHSVKKK